MSESQADDVWPLTWECPYCGVTVGAETPDGVEGYADSHLRKAHEITIDEYKERWPNV